MKLLPPHQQIIFARCSFSCGDSGLSALIRALREVHADASELKTVKIVRGESVANQRQTDRLTLWQPAGRRPIAEKASASALIKLSRNAGWRRDTEFTVIVKACVL